jgi:hypothetical protein
MTSIRMPRVLSVLTRSVIVVLGAMLASCATVEELAQAGKAPQFYAPVNVQAANQLPADIRRVVLLPVYCGEVAPEETGLSFDTALLAALQKQMRFEVVPASRDDLRRKFGAPEFSSANALPHGFLDALGADYAADAVLLVDLTALRPIRPLNLGFRAKLATVREVRLLWSFDEVLTADEPTVRRSALRASAGSRREKTPYDLSPATLQSPARFAAFVAGEMFATLPPR